MWWNIVSRKVPDSCPVICVGPKVLEITYHIISEICESVHWVLFFPLSFWTHPNRVLTTRANPRWFCEIKGHGSGFIKGVQLEGVGNSIATNSNLRTYQHENYTILGRPAPVLCGVSTITGPIRLRNLNGQEIDTNLKHPNATILTLIPHLNGDILLPTTGSWLISRISLFFRIPRTSGVIADSYCIAMLSDFLFVLGTIRMEVTYVCTDLGLPGKGFRWRWYVR